MTNHKEKRKYRRMRKPSIVRFQIRSEENHNSDSSEWSMGAVLNIGAGGLLFYHTKKMDLDATLDLKIHLHSPETSIDCVGKVIRVEQIPHMYLVAALFTEINDSDRKLIDSVAVDFHPEVLND